MGRPNDNYLVISDLQIPFEAEEGPNSLGALKFCIEVAKEFKIPKENILNVGDETDQYFGSFFPKSPDARMSALEELELAKKRLKRWYQAFPYMRIATSNHGVRWAKKAFQAEIPSVLMKQYQEVIEAPPTWKWSDEWIIKNIDSPFRVIHGMGYSGINGHRTAALDAGMSTCIGHLHSHAGIARISTGINEIGKRNIWGMNVGCLINPKAFCFEYGKWSRMKPTMGVGVVIGSGRTPIFIPYE